MAKKGEYVLIGAGLPRTGTSSMQFALKELLGGECYHMRTLMENKKDPKHVEFWIKGIKRQLSARVKILASYQDYGL